MSHRYALTDEISESKKQKELDDLKQEVQDLKAELKEQKEVYNTLIDRYDELADAKLRAEKLLEKQGVELDSLHGLVDKLTQLETDCAIKDQLIQQKDDELDAAKASGELTKAELTKLTKELHTLSEELDKQLDEKEELEAQLEELLRNSNEELQDVNTKYLEIVKDYNKVLVDLDA